LKTLPSSAAKSSHRLENQVCANKVFVWISVRATGHTSTPAIAYDGVCFVLVAGSGERAVTNVVTTRARCEPIRARDTSQDFPLLEISQFDRPTLTTQPNTLLPNPSQNCTLSSTPYFTTDFPCTAPESVIHYAEQ
jgi:hypothetical protein